MPFPFPTKKITQLPAGTLPITGDELIEMSQGGVSVQIPSRAFPIATDALLTFAGMFGSLPGSRQLVPGPGVQFNLTVPHEMAVEIIGTGAVSGNPTALIGMAVINGVAATWMRSDAAPAIDPAINPVWTGLHTVSNTNPQSRWNESDGAANNRLWGVNVQGEQFSLGVLTDAGVFAPWVSVDRTGQVIDVITFQGPTQAVAAVRGNSTSHATGANQALDLSLGNTFYETLGGNTAFTFTNPPVSGREQTFTIFLRQDGVGTRIPTWPASVHWSDGLTPVLTTTINRVDAVTLTTVDGGVTYYGGQVLANMVP